MAFVFNVNLSLSFSSTTHKGELTMGQWAKDAFNRLQHNEGTQHEHNQRMVLERHQLMADSPSRWKELVAAIFEEVQDFASMRPDHLTMTSSTDTTLQVNTPFRRLNITFNPPSPKIIYIVSERRGPSKPWEKIAEDTYLFEVQDKEVWLMEKGKPVAIPEVTLKLLNFLG
jgi:hypothetical protein